ncbi:MAG: PEP-CTERM sorting domain-containing protein [Planctomycetes bacterium]|nr:PEP-CTERM sorting domain-containing protein [Planctomycetota bacterium]
MLRKLIPCAIIVLICGTAANAEVLLGGMTTMENATQLGGTGYATESDYLLNNGSVAAGSGRTVSGQNIAGGWAVFQPFEVTGPGWFVETIGVDGWNVQDPLGKGMLGTLLPDDNGNPDENNPIAFEDYFLGTDAFNSNWRDETFNVALTPGMYWMRWSDVGDINHWSAIFPGTSGLNSFSRQTSTGNIYPAAATALRIAGYEVPEPTTLSLLAVGLLGVLRRR